MKALCLPVLITMGVLMHACLHAYINTDTCVAQYVDAGTIHISILCLLLCSRP